MEPLVLVQPIVMDDPNFPALQREVQRLLGRCMLRLQQYETLMKDILARHELSATLSSLEAQLGQRSDRFSGKTLGQLVQSFFDSYVVASGREVDPPRSPAIHPAQFAFAYKLSIQMSNDDHAKVKSSIDEMVSLRNELVHHFTGRFDLGSTHGCVEAAKHLEASYVQIDNHYAELKAWANDLNEILVQMANWMRSKEFEELILNGVSPDGSFQWPATGIVSALRQAAKNLAIDGWTRLDDATAWVLEKDPEQVPMKYQCRTWQQVLAESKEFELVYRREANDQKVVWYRPLS